MMLDGTLRAVEDVKINEYLLGPDSTPRRVMAVTQGIGPLYRVDQAGGGQSYVVNNKHVLSLKKSHAEGFRPSRSKQGSGKVIPTSRYPNESDIVNISIEEFLKKSSKWKSVFFGYKAGLVEFVSLPGNLPIDPYFLGMWLGDGTSRELRITCHVDDWEIIKYCTDYVAGFDLDTSVCVKEGVNAYDVGFAWRSAGKGAGRENKLWQLFLQLGLKNDKHIPAEYLIASEQERLNLLAGLLDSDGYCHNGGYEFANTNKELAYGVKQLADFLGFKTNMHVKPPRGNCATKYRLSINGDTWRVPCLLPRKRVKQSDLKKNKDFSLMGLKITSIGEGEYFGFELDGDHLFMLEDGTVTHNSWAFARALLLIGLQRPIRVLCCRELQKSISESVHKVLSDQIEALGLSAQYTVEVAKIYGKNGTLFSFEGIKNNTTAVKSYEGIDYCWVEEANKVSKASWGVLIPTIRKETPYDWRERGLARPDFQAEIWLSFNPELDKDYTFQRFVKDNRLKPVHHLGTAGREWVSHESPDLISVKMTYADNPWFPEVLRGDMETDRLLDYDTYLNVWEGHTLKQLEGAVYKKELQKLYAQERVRNVPWEREVPVDCFWDLGRNDYTAIWFGQYVAQEFRVLDFLEGRGEDITYYLKELQQKEYIYGNMFLPHDAKHKKLVYKHSIEKIVKDKYPDTFIVPKAGITDGINMARLFFPKCYFDQEKCADGLAHLNRYTFTVHDGQYSDEPFHDREGHADAADAFRYMAQAAGGGKRKSRLRLENFLPESMKPKSRYRDLDSEGSGNPQGWMG